MFEILCVVPENIHTHPREGKSKMFKGKFEPILELGWGFKPKIPLWEGYGFFLEHNIQCNIPNLYVTVIREENTVVLQTFYL